MILYRKAFENFDHNFIGSSVMALIVQSCIGGTAAMYILSNGTSILQMIQLSIVVLLCMFVNTSVLALMKHKLVFNSAIVSVLLSILFIIINNIAF